MTGTSDGAAAAVPTAVVGELQGIGSDSIIRAIFHHVAQLVGPPEMGFSTRTHLIGTGSWRLTSVLEPHLIPGSASLSHTHMSHGGRRRPKISVENPGG
jgi:hypothetical protein